MNQNTVDQLAECIINETNSAVSCLIWIDILMKLTNGQPFFGFKFYTFMERWLENASRVSHDI